MKTQEELNNLSKIILDASISVHRIMGPGLLESIYVECLVYELKNRGLIVDTEVTIPLIYKEKKLSKRFRIDVLVENEIIIEVKAIEILLPVHEAQIISHLKLADKRLGFLINFNVPILIKGLKRFVNNF